MIQKSILQSVITKYYLGENESVKWEINDKELVINFMSPNNEVIGKVTCKDIPLPTSKLAIFDTKKLRNLINITSGEVILELEQQNQLYTKLKISDLNYNLTYALSDSLLIGEVGTVNEQTFNINLNLNEDNISALIKAKGPLNEVDNFKINTVRDLDDNLVCEFLFGDETGHNNKITYQIQGEIDKEDLSIPFNSNMFKTILDANKDQDGGTLQVSSTGLLYLRFSSEQITSEYYMVRKADENF